MNVEELVQDKAALPWGYRTVNFGAKATKHMESLADAAELFAIEHLKGVYQKDYAQLMALVTRVRWDIDIQALKDG